MHCAICGKDWLGRTTRDEAQGRDPTLCPGQQAIIHGCLPKIVHLPKRHLIQLPELRRGLHNRSLRWSYRLRDTSLCAAAGSASQLLYAVASYHCRMDFCSHAGSGIDERTSYSTAMRRGITLKRMR